MVVGGLVGGTVVWGAVVGGAVVPGTVVAGDVVGEPVAGGDVVITPVVGGDVAGGDVVGEPVTGDDVLDGAWVTGGEVVDSPGVDVVVDETVGGQAMGSAAVLAAQNGLQYPMIRVRPCASGISTRQSLATGSPE